MKGWVLILSFSLLALLPSDSLAIGFDIWETGMNIDEVVGLAREHDIPIMRDGIIAIRERFDAKLIDNNFYKASTVYYRTNISGRNAIVYLRLTDDPKFVYEIEVKLFGIRDKDLFTKEMLGILNEKYGPSKKIMETVFPVYQWRPDQSSQVRMRVFGPEASVIYTDLGTKELLENQRREKEKRLIRKDGGKF